MRSIRYCFLTICFLSPVLYSCVEEGKYGKKVSDSQPADLVNPLVGTASSFDFSTGNTYPAIAVPWGMNFWTPQTAPMGDGWAYTYDAKKIRGFKQTHQASPWLNDYGAFSIMPVVGELKIGEDDRAAWFSHKEEASRPYYYKVFLADYETLVEITPTERAAQFRITFPDSDYSYILIDGFDMGSMVEADPENRRITGYCRNNHGGVPENFHNYFVAIFDKPFEVVGTWNGVKFLDGSDKQEGEHVGVVLRFETKRGEEIGIMVASSFISPEQADLNLTREIGDNSFIETKNKAKKHWNDALSRFEVRGGTLEQQKTFYTALYRTMLFPRIFYEVDSIKQIVHYSPYNGKVEPGYMYTDNGFWDTFRAVFPLFNIMHREQNSKIMQGLANTFLESGWLPEWASPGHRSAMIGSNSTSIIADAYLSGIEGFDIDILYEAILKNTKKEGPLHSVGRRGVDYYNHLGYVPYDVGINESAARTLEYAYADYCIWQLAKSLNRPRKEIDLFHERANNYNLLFNKETGFMCGKNEDGSWQENFNEYKWGDAFTEGNAWHYTWSVFQDLAGLAELMGGRKAMESKLDALFEAPLTSDHSYYGFQIHEITEMKVANMGQYAHGNQPMQHGIYLYNYVGAPWKTQYWVREVMNRLYTPYPDGLCGDEDNGQTSAWYVFSALGFYPVCPGSQQYVIGSPLFDQAILSLENGNKFEVIAEGNSRDNKYIQQASLNGQALNRSWINQDEILQGGTLTLEMGPDPNKNWATDPAHAPYSMSEE